MKKHFEQLLDNNSLDNLSQAIDKSITFYFPDIEVDIESGVLTVSSISISVDDRFLIIHNDWNDTPIDYIDYYFLEVKTASKPFNIRYKKSWNGTREFTGPVSQLNTKNNQFHVKSIKVYNFESEETSESVNYDSAILFHDTQGNEILISDDESIIGRLEIRYKSNSINEKLNNLKLRKNF